MGKSMIRLLVFPLLIVMLIIAGCSSDTTKTSDETPKDNDDVTNETPTGDLAPLEETAKVVIAEDGSASGAGFYIAKEQGYFEDYNIEVEFATFGNSDDMLPALAAGEVDIAGGISSASFFNSIAQGIDVKMVADKGHNVEGKSYFTFVVDKEQADVIQDYSDIKGKRIAVSTRNAVDDYIFQIMLEHTGLTRDDVEFELMSDFGNMLSAMGSDSIDLALQIEPLITQGVEEGIHERFGDATDFAPKAQIAMVLASPVFLEEREDVALRFMVAYLKGVRDYNDAFVKETGDLDRIIDIMTQHTPMKDKELWQNVSVTGLNPNGEMFIDDIEKQYETYKANGAIKGEVNFDDAIDTTLTEKAVEILGEYK